MSFCGVSQMDCKPETVSELGVGHLDFDNATHVFPLVVLQQLSQREVACSFELPHHAGKLKKLKKTRQSFHHPSHYASPSAFLLEGVDSERELCF